MRLPVCWLTVSIKGALENHEKATGTKMFDWKVMGLICDQYQNTGLMITTSGEL
jgi:hypothetical protein